MPTSFHTPRTILEAGVAAGAFPGAVAELWRGGALEARCAVGKLGVETPFLQPVTPQTRYDLASLTKLFTLTAALGVLRAEGLKLETPLSHFWPEFSSAITSEITLEDLMAHRSGIHFPLQALHETQSDEWLPRIFASERKAPGTAVHYCCTNYFLLARVLELIGGESLDRLIQRLILRPLHLETASFAPENLADVAPTERHENGFLHGVVHDEATRSWRRQSGSCAGNAGLFASASDVAHFAAAWLEPDMGVVHPDDIERALRPIAVENLHFRGLGWQVDAAFYMGEATPLGTTPLGTAPLGTAGHLGFTGPSLILHRETRSVAVILSNRVHPTRCGPDRLGFHRDIARWLFSRGQISNL